jgi:sec-independent protein translocase protein TatB
MLPQLGFAEMIVLALLAIIVVGPKDLPKLMRSFGNIMAKIRGLGQEFKDAFDEMGAEDEIAEMRKELEDLKKMGSVKSLTGDLEEEMRALDRDLRSSADPKPKSNPKSQTNPELQVKPESEESRPETRPESSE